MRKRNTLALVITSLSIAGLVLMAVILSLYMSDDASSLKKYIPWSQDNQNTPVNDRITPSLPVTEVPFGDTNETGETNLTEYPPHQFVIVGDSRTVAMQEAVNALQEDGCIYIAKSGEGYDWFINYGSNTLNDTLHQNPGLTILFNLGVNDLVNIESYISLYESYMAEYPEASFYIMSVNPVDESFKLNVSNEKINDFNKKLLEAFPKQLIDTNHYLSNEGYTTVDGLHYDQETSRKLHGYLVDTLIKS